MRYLNYLLLGISTCVTVFLFILSANQIELVPYKNHVNKSEQVMLIEKSTDLNKLKDMAENIIVKDHEIFEQFSYVAARLNTWLVLLFILQILMGILFFLQYRKRKSEQL